MNYESEETFCSFTVLQLHTAVEVLLHRGITKGFITFTRVLAIRDTNTPCDGRALILVGAICLKQDGEEP